MVTGVATFQSAALKRNISYSFIIPESKGSEGSVDFSTLYLLSGFSGDHQDWIKDSLITQLAEKYQIAVIMPSGENSYFVDHPNQNRYGTFIGEELVQETRRIFPLSSSKEQTWIAGLSMGGYGALRNGLAYNSYFSKIGAMSSRILSRRISDLNLSDEKDTDIRIKHFIESETLETLPDSMDIFSLVNQTNNYPGIYLTCGTEDSRFEENKQLHHYLQEENIEHIFDEDSGDHNWAFWNKKIEPIIQWMTGKHV